MKLLLVIAIMPALLCGARILTLGEALAVAEKQSPDVQIARLRILEREAGEWNARAGYRPQLSASITSAYQTNNIQGIGLVLPNVSSRLGPYRYFDARPVMTQTVVDLSLLSFIRAARERRIESQQQAVVVREQTQFAVIQLYLQALQAASRIAAAEARLQTAEAVRGQTAELERGGAASKLDLARAEQQFHTEQTLVIQARRDREVLGSMLMHAIGIDPGDTVELQTPRVATIAAPGAVETNAAALAGRAELSALAAKNRAAVEERTRARRERLPKISFSGDFGLLGQGPDASLSTYSIGGSITVPLWTSGAIASATAAAHSRVLQVEQEQRAARLRIAQEVRQAIAESVAAKDALRAATKASAAARVALELARLRFAAGLGTNIDTVQAQGSLAESEDSEIRIRYDGLIALAKLGYVRGNVKEYFE